MTLSEFTFPNDIYSFILEKLDEQGISYKELLKKLRTWSKKIKSFSEEKIDPIALLVDEFSTPLISTLKIAVSLLKPLVALIPPQYLALGAGIIAVPFVAVPMWFAGIFAWYLAEDWLKIRRKVRKHVYDSFPQEIKNNREIVKTKKECRLFYVTKAHIDIPLVGDYLEDVYEKLAIPNDWEKDAEPILIPDESTDEYDVYQACKIYYFYWKNVLPPILHTLVTLFFAFFMREDSPFKAALRGLDPANFQGGFFKKFLTGAKEYYTAYGKFLRRLFSGDL